MIDHESLNFKKALETGDTNLMRKVPRADVHNHVSLGGNFQSWVAKEGLVLKEGKHHFPDFTDFQKRVNTIFTYPYNQPTKEQQIERFFSLYEETYKAAIADGVTYIEPGYDAVLLDLFDLDIDVMLRKIEDQINNYSDRITIAPDIGIIRIFDLKDIERTIFPCIESGFFKGLDIFADERVGPPEDFTHIYRAAKKSGMKLKAHAGELLGADFVRRNVEVLDLDEVQHGISAAQSKEVMSFLAEKQTRLNICPSSNIQLCQTESYKTHPLRILLDHGVKTTVNTDDTIIFGKTSSDEFFSLYDTELYTTEELNQIRLNGFPN